MTPTRQNRSRMAYKRSLSGRGDAPSSGSGRFCNTRALRESALLLAVAFFASAGGVFAAETPVSRPPTGLDSVLSSLPLVIFLGACLFFTVLMAASAAWAAIWDWWQQPKSKAGNLNSDEQPAQ